MRGRRSGTFGREHWSEKFYGGTLFYDHASGCIFVKHQVSLGATDTIRSLKSVVQEAMQCGVEIKKIRTDNGSDLTSQEFCEQLESNKQVMELSAVGAHHQNGVAERNIGVVHAMSRALLLHLKIMWPDEFSADLWPFAIDCAVHIHNHVPRKGGLSPMEIFCGTRIDCKPLKKARVFGCPAYVLDPRIQDGKKILKWEPKAHLGQFLGFSLEHASNVGLIRNMETGWISPQFHIVCNEPFQTVALEHNIDLSETWIDLFVSSQDN